MLWVLTIQNATMWSGKLARKENSSLSVRVNGRARYWSGGTRDISRYMHIPGGPSFENFELREKYVPGQLFYYGLSRKTPEELVERL
ncbi:hypothetical protein [Parapedobacter soli]|uniref:hypothetical protein n=1 Tax=Parapedobacter soli TaxID=416955 RepID=UPI0021CAC99E|nr:hypothetical protein [Parapedobacter soli]